jgi:dihydrofolate reductase
MRPGYPGATPALRGTGRPATRDCLLAIDGSRVLVQTLTQHDLVDEYSLLVYPVVLGSGKKLFADGCASTCA